MVNIPKAPLKSESNKIGGRREKMNGRAQIPRFLSIPELITSQHVSGRRGETLSAFLPPTKRLPRPLPLFPLQAELISITDCSLLTS